MRNYTTKAGVKIREMTVKPDSKNGVFDVADITKYVNNNLKNVAPHKRVVVRALNILGDRTLDTFNTTLKQGKDAKMMSVEEYDDYLKGKLKDPTKFKHFFSFTITIYEDPDEDTFMF